MSDFKVLVYKVVVKDHPNADKLDLCQVNDYVSCVKKGDFKTGDLVAYIPEAALVPENILEEIGLSGRLAGSKKNRVKAIRLRSVLSQGICYPAREGWVEGQDVADELGVTKWEPPIPACLAGEVWNAGSYRTLGFDINNVKNHPDVLEDGEEVVFTEKIHGTFMQIGVMPEKLRDETYGVDIVASKGLGGKGLAFKDNNTNTKNLYWRAAKQFKLHDKIRDQFKYELGIGEQVFMLGEVFGQGVQDLVYGASTGNDKTIGFRVFDVYVGQPGMGRYLHDAELDMVCEKMELQRVPVLYRGPFSKNVMLQFTNGKETVSGKSMHIREGIVIKPTIERQHNLLGRVVLKSVSGDYLVRNGGTEYN